MKRTDIKRFRDIPNVGIAIEKDFFALGMGHPVDLIGKDPYQMYNDLCRIRHRKYDPSVLDVFISAVHYMEGGPTKKWWEFTQERKKYLGNSQ